MDTNEILVMAIAAGVCGFYAVMVFLSQRRKKDAGKAAPGQPMPVRRDGTESSGG
ncbi:MAG: hypothetical protein AB7O56_03630 [Bauldia sp.]